jgi:catechol 2,3-dioxygenase-like lactoylglutathione lyase family enzyme
MAKRKAAIRKPVARAAKPGTKKKKAAKAAVKPAAKRGKAAVEGMDRRRRDPETLRLRSFMPAITVNDLDRSRRFYTDVLGFIVEEQWKDGDKLRGMSLRAGVCSLGLSQDDWSKGRDRKKGEGVRLWCETGQDIAALAGRIKEAGGRLSEDVTDQPWGARSIGIDDPDGYHLTIFQQQQK